MNTNIDLVKELDIMEAIKTSYGGMAEMVQEVTDILSMSPQSNGDIWSMIRHVFEVLLPIGFSIATIFILISFVSKAMLFKVNNYEQIVKIFLIAAIGKALLENSFDILGWIYQTVAHMITSIGVNPTPVESVVDIDALSAAIEEMGFLDKLMFMMQQAPVWLILKLMKAMAYVIAYGRLIEIYIYTAIAPIPLATAVSEEYNHIAKSFFQRYIGVCLQGLIMLLACVIYSALSVQLIDPSGDSATMGGGLSFLMSSGVLLFVLVKSGAWGKQIAGLAG